MTNEPSPKYVTVARILRSRGNKGEVAAEVLTDFADRLKEFRELFLSDGKTAPRAMALKSFWVDRNHPGHCVFHFEGIASIDAAEKLRGLEVQIPFEQRAALPSGKYFVTDLIGCEVFEGSFRVGSVRDVYFPGETQPGTPLLALNTPRGELLIPLAEDICTRIDTAARRIEVTLPVGLRSIDEPG